MGASLAAETNESQDGESRLKAGCSQDWLPHKARGFLGSNLRRRASSFIGRGNLDRRSPAPHTSAADRPGGLSHIAIDAPKNRPAESMDCDEFPESACATADLRLPQELRVFLRASASRTAMSKSAVPVRLFCGNEHKDEHAK